MMEHTMNLLMAAHAAALAEAVALLAAATEAVAAAFTAAAAAATAAVTRVCLFAQAATGPSASALEEADNYL